MRHKREKKTVQSQPNCTTNNGRFQGTAGQSCFEEIRRTQHSTYQSPMKYDTSVSAIRPKCQWLFIVIQTIHEAKICGRLRK